MNADDVITMREVIFLAVFGVLIFLVPLAVVWASYKHDGRFAKFDVSAIWTHQGRIDKFAVIIVGTWWVHTCSMVLWTLLGKVSTADYATYMGWAIPIIAKMFSGGGSPPSPGPGASGAPSSLAPPPAKP